jgi:hypothetical protein
MQNAIGQDLSPAQQELMECYDSLAKVLGDQSAELAPFEQRNAQKALAALWQIANGLDMDRGHMYHLGV